MRLQLEVQPEAQKQNAAVTGLQWRIVCVDLVLPVEINNDNIFATLRTVSYRLTAELAKPVLSASELNLNLKVNLFSSPSVT